VAANPSGRDLGGSASLPMRASPTRVPPSFRGVVHTEEAASRKASLVSGPFEATPDLYVLPADRDDLSLLVRWAAERRIPLVPRGSGTGMPGGNLGPGVVVDLSSLSDRGPVDQDRRTIRVGAGVVADRIQEVAMESGLRLPALPASSRWCSAGGMAANNAAGPRSFRHGAFHRWVVGAEGIDAWGEPFRVTSERHAPERDPDSGEGRDPAELPGPFRSLEGILPLDGDGRIPGWPRVRKNASGYALDRYLPDLDPVQLLVGSEGTLAFMTHLELKLAPAPAERGLVVLPADGPTELVAIAREARRSGAVTCEFLGRRLLEMTALSGDPEVGSLATGAYALLLLEVEGSSDEVEEEIRRLRTLTGTPRASIGTTDRGTMARLWKLRHRASPIIAREADRGRISTQFIEDSVVPPALLGEYLEGIDEILEGHRFDAVVFGHAGDGNVHVNPLVDVASSDWKDRMRRTLDETARLVRALGGTLSGEHGDGRLRAPLLASIWPEACLDAFRTVKDAFDPVGILNPGVILPLPGQDPLDHLRPRPRSFP